MKLILVYVKFRDFARRGELN